MSSKRLEVNWNSNSEITLSDLERLLSMPVKVDSRPVRLLKDNGFPVVNVLAEMERRAEEALKQLPIFEWVLLQTCCPRCGGTHYPYNKGGKWIREIVNQDAYNSWQASR